MDRRVQSQALKRVLPRWPHFGRQPGSPFSLAPELAARTERAQVLRTVAPGRLRGDRFLSRSHCRFGEQTLSSADPAAAAILSDSNDPGAYQRIGSRTRPKPRHQMPPWPVLSLLREEAIEPVTFPRVLLAAVTSGVARRSPPFPSDVPPFARPLAAAGRRASHTPLPSPPVWPWAPTRAVPPASGRLSRRCRCGQRAPGGAARCLPGPAGSARTAGPAAGLTGMRRFFSFSFWPVRSPVAVRIPGTSALR